MKYLKKQVVRLKTNRFMQKNNCILLLHYKNVEGKNRDLDKLFTGQKKAAGGASPLPTFADELTPGVLHGASLLLKNKIAYKVGLIKGAYTQYAISIDALAAGTSAHTLLEESQRINLVLEEGKKISCAGTSKGLYEEMPLFCSKDALCYHLEKNRNREKAHQTKQKVTLFHGPTLLLKVERLSELEQVLHFYENTNLFILFAAFYKNKIINLRQISKLCKVSKRGEMSVYHDLLVCMQKAAIQNIQSICTPFHLFTFKMLQYKLIHLLKQVR